ncbi:conidial pigment biosynthesis scytalone dehydratase Arp1 [Cordyceps militaris CM01]|uniref:Conidial pigment biosynthesis scytalone dehydratase Arp1 n=1 Tax=Cordyceps militaris (strain CM01) TaxID=983644 RepID=G3JFQ7_CORMM|nr:conidial pigment biosynthesis scytalone dehydratase Arp1 [Cordyceps militaris CM01]EGX92290.1 conidial pigment biosynthesis scytalone dehydratase Arp1 [Cordyceps militaris CM01]
MTFSSAVTRAASSSSAISFQDYLEVSALLFDWGDSYDAKDWPRLRRIIAPTLYVDYSKIGKDIWEAMSADDFVAMVSDDDFLGDPCVKTQHLLGATRWERISATEIIGHHQLRAAHQVYTAPDLKTVKLHGHSHATNKHYYTKVDGVWKFAGLAPLVRWNEHDFEKVFKGSFIA